MEEPRPTLVWTEIPVTDLPAATAFYKSVFGYLMERQEEEGRVTVFFDHGISGHLFEGAPPARGTGPVIHLAIEGGLEAAMARCKAAGGTVTSPAIAIPPGRFAYAEDLDGNRLGLFEPKG